MLAVFMRVGLALAFWKRAFRGLGRAFLADSAFLRRGLALLAQRWLFSRLAAFTCLRLFVFSGRLGGLVVGVSPATGAWAFRLLLRSMSFEFSFLAVITAVDT